MALEWNSTANSVLKASRLTAKPFTSFCVTGNGLIRKKNKESEDLLQERRNNITGIETGTEQDVIAKNKATNGKESSFVA